MPNVAQSDRTVLRRRRERGRYDRETIRQILDSTFLCHVGFLHNGQPFVIPTAFGREDEALYIHGSANSRMQTLLASGIDVCVTVTIVDAIVLARAAFRASINYRSVVLFGRSVPITETEEKVRALSIITEHIVPGRWREVRPPTPQELSVTSVLRIPIDEASAKIRTGPPQDEAKDLALPVWAGTLPIEVRFGEPEPDPNQTIDIDLPDYLNTDRPRRRV